MEVMEVKAGYNSTPKTHRDLKIYRQSFELAMLISTVSREFPRDEQFEMCSQIRRSARSVSANIAEAWRKRRYRASFIAKLSDSETEAAETQCWLEFALAEGYISEAKFDELFSRYETLIGSIVGVIGHADKWVLRDSSPKSSPSPSSPVS